MEKSNRILIGAIFILIVALISFNYDKIITGQVIVTKSKISISITPDVISSGQKIYVTVHPSPEGVHQRACFYQAEDELRKGCTYRVCDNYKCLEDSTFSFSTFGWEPGIHYVKVFDYEINDYVKTFFTIT